MDTVAIDVGSAFVGLCKWDGETLLVRKVSACSIAECGSDWLDCLQPRRPFQLLYRCTHADFARETRPDVLRDWAVGHGARGFRFLTTETASNPVLAAARYAADRHRLGAIVCTEIGARHATLAVQAAYGERLAGDTIALDIGTTPDLPELARTLCRVITDAGIREGITDVHQLPLVCGGGAGPEIAARLAERCQLYHVLIPAHAGTMTTIGMLMADIVLNFRESFGRAPFELAALRAGFLRLMDRASTAITREGYDLDNAVCRRIAELAFAGGKPGIELDCDSLADGESLLERFQAAYEDRYGPGRPDASVEICNIQVIAVVETLKPELPIPAIPVGGLKEAILSRHDAFRDLSPEGIVYEQEKLPVNHKFSGPAAVWEDHTTTFIPPGWFAHRTPCGGLFLEREAR